METDGVASNLPLRDELFYDSRLRTFAMWPKQLLQRKTDMARAGFYYSGDNDTVKCFMCKVCINQWEAFDVPLIEHFKWSPDCTYLKMIGQDETDTVHSFQIGCMRSEGGPTKRPTSGTSKH